MLSGELPNKTEIRRKIVGGGGNVNKENKLKDEDFRVSFDEFVLLESRISMSMFALKHLVSIIRRRSGYQKRNSFAFLKLTGRLKRELGDFCDSYF